MILEFKAIWLPIQEPGKDKQDSKVSLHVSELRVQGLNHYIVLLPDQNSTKTLSWLTNSMTLIPYNNGMYRLNLPHIENQSYSVG